MKTLINFCFCSKEHYYCGQCFSIAKVSSLVTTNLNLTVPIAASAPCAISHSRKKEGTMPLTDLILSWGKSAWGIYHIRCNLWPTLSRKPDKVEPCPALQNCWTWREPDAAHFTFNCTEINLCCSSESLAMFQRGELRNPKGDWITEKFFEM